MEKEKKGLFRRLLDFWKGKDEETVSEGHDFWRKAEEKPGFAELGAVAAMSQREARMTFWERTAEQEQRAENAFLEMAEKKKYSPIQEREKLPGEKSREATEEELLHRGRTGKTAGETVQKKKKTEVSEGKERSWLSAEIFEEKAEQQKKIFSAEMPEEKQEDRKVIPVERISGKREIAAEDTRISAEQKQAQKEDKGQIAEQKAVETESRQAEPVIDIERLMEQMTKRLWEERESSGRRLR